MARPALLNASSPRSDIILLGAKSNGPEGFLPAAALASSSAFAFAMIAGTIASRLTNAVTSAFGCRCRSAAKPLDAVIGSSTPPCAMRRSSLQRRLRHRHQERPVRDRPGDHFAEFLLRSGRLHHDMHRRSLELLLDIPLLVLLRHLQQHGGELRPFAPIFAAKTNEGGVSWSPFIAGVMSRTASVISPENRSRISSGVIPVRDWVLSTNALYPPRTRTSPGRARRTSAPPARPRCGPAGCAPSSSADPAGCARAARTGAGRDEAGSSGTAGALHANSGASRRRDRLRRVGFMAGRGNTRITSPAGCAAGKDNGIRHSDSGGRRRRRRGCAGTPSASPRGSRSSPLRPRASSPSCCSRPRPRRSG